MNMAPDISRSAPPNEGLHSLLGRPLVTESSRWAGDTLRGWNREKRTFLRLEICLCEAVNHS